MKRILSLILCFSMFFSLFVMSKPVKVSAEGENALKEIENTADTLDITDLSSFKYAVPNLSSSSGTLTTQLVKDTTLRTPLCKYATGWDGAFVISSTDGSLTGLVAGKAQESFTLQWIHRIFMLGNNTLMFYVELPEYQKADASWGLSINSFYVEQDGIKFYLNKDKTVSYSYLQLNSSGWKYDKTSTVNGTKSVFDALPSGFKGYVRVDASSASFWDSNGKSFDYSKYYRFENIGFGFNAVGGECGELIFGGVLYYPQNDNDTSTLLNYFGMEYHQLGGNTDAVIATAHAAKWNVTVSDVSGAAATATVSDYTASCPGGGNGVAVDSTTGAAISSAHMYNRLWPNIKMQPGVDTFMIYVELPEFTADTPALYLAMPATKQNESWMTYIDPAGARYSYLSVGGESWQTGKIGSNGELSELGSGFKGYIKFNIKNFAFYTDGTGIKSTYDFTKCYNIENIQLRFNHVGGDNGKLIIGAFYSVLQDSNSTAITTVSGTLAEEKALSTVKITAVNNTSAVLSTEELSDGLNTVISKDLSIYQAASDKADGFDGAYRISSKDGSLTGVAGGKAQESLVMQAVDTEIAASNGIMLYVKLPDFEKADADWALSLSSVKLYQGGKTFIANLAKRSKFMYLSATGNEWQEGVTKTVGGVNSVLSGPASGFEGYICLDLTSLDYSSIENFDVNSSYTVKELGFGYNSVGGECGDIVIGGILYILDRRVGLTTAVNICERSYELTENGAAVIVSSAGARDNVSISNVSGGEVTTSAAYTTTDCVGCVADTSAVISSTTGEVVTDLHMYSKKWLSINMQPGVDTYMVYLEMPEYSEKGSAIYISQPAFANGGSEVYIDWTGGKYSYMSIYDGEWKTASIGSEGELACIGSGFKGYVKFDLKTFSGFDNFKSALDVTTPYSLTDVRFCYRYVGSDNGNLVIGAVYTVTEDSNKPYITVTDKRRVTSARYIFGDIIANGKVDAEDILKARKVLLGSDRLTASEFERGDANQDGNVINIADLVRMKKIAASAAEAESLKDYTDNSGLSISKWIESGQIPYYTEGTVTQTKSGETTVMTAVGTSSDTYKAYLKALEYAGFELYTKNTAGDNLFATYINDCLTVNAYFIASNSTARIIWEPKGSLPGLECENIYDASEKVKSQITGICLDVNGMSFVIRLEDNSFIVIDGGTADGTNTMSKNLYEQIVAQTPSGEKPVIAAWIFTHAHNDHIGNFNEFSLNYHDNVVIERFFYNFPSDEEILSNNLEVPLNNLKQYGAFKKVMAEYYSDVPTVKVHTGNKFYVRNAEIEVLYTFEDFYPTALAESDFNSTSVVYRTYVEGQSVLWLGDSTAESEALLVEQFGNYLKSDVLQLAHHGINGTVASYQVYDPVYALNPTNKSLYYSYIDNAANSWLINQSIDFKQMLVTAFGTFTAELPIDLTGDYPGHPYAEDYVNPELFE